MQQTISFQVRACAVLCCAAFVGVTSASGQPVPQGYGNASLAYQDRLTPLERVMPKLNRAVSVRFADVSLEEALLEIGAGAGLDVSYSSEKARASRHRVTLALERVTALEALHKVLEGSGLKLMVAPGEQLILTRQTEPARTSAEAPPVVHEVSGTVISEEGAPLPGVNVVVKGTTIGTITDADGTYSLEAPEPTDTLVFSFVGFLGQEVPIAGRSTVDVALAEDQVALDEVVVIGYGELSRRQVTSAISSIDAGEIEDVPAASLDNLMQGRVAGVQVTQNSGQPGGGVSVRIRGITSIGGGNDPLYVVDGVPIKSGNFGGLADEGSGLNALADINPDDIASIEVLKDAAATSIYGARASNGVVLITTKRGRPAAPAVNVSVYRGFQEVANTLPAINARQAREYIIESHTRPDGSEFGTIYRALDSLNIRYNNDVYWQDYLFQTAPLLNADVSASGGAENIRYYVSGTYLDQDGVIRNSQFKRYTARANVDYAISPRFRIGNNLSYSNTQTNRVSEGVGGGRGVLWRTLTRLPVEGAYQPDGTLFTNQPIATLLDSYQDAGTNRFIGSLFGELTLVEGLKWRSQVSLDLLSLKEDRFFPSTIYTYGAFRQTAASRYVQDLGIVAQNYLTYSRTFKGAHGLNALLGIDVQRSEYENLGGNTSQSPTDLIPTLNAGAVAEDVYSYNTAWALLSYYGRLNYDFKGKYLLGATVRVDGSSRFGEGNRYGVFPSASVAWRVSDEPFLADVRALDELKLRASAGLTGNQEIGNFAAQALYGSGRDYMGQGGVSASNLANPNLSWESTAQFDAGLDVGLWSRLSLVADVYYKETSDLLFFVNLPLETGFGGALTNLGRVRNRGFEIELTSQNLRGALTWTTAANVGVNRNRILELPEGEDIISGWYGVGGILREGEPVGTFWGYKMLGVYATDEDNAEGIRFNGPNGPVAEGGDAIFQDTNGDGYISDADRVIIGNANPDFVGGLTNTFTWRGFELSAFLNFSYGNDAVNYLRRERDGHRLGTGAGATTDVLRRWRAPGDVTDVPRAIRGDPRGNFRPDSDYFLEDASYLRLKNITLAYNLPRRFAQRLRAQRLRAYVMGQNLYTWTSYTGFDPETVSAQTSGGSRRLVYGVDNGIYPLARTITVGLNLGF